MTGKNRSGFHHIMDDFKQGDHKRTIRRDLRDLYSFYLDEEERHRLASMSKLKRWFLVTWWLAKSLFFNLLPTRRILLLISVWLTIQGDTSFNLTETVELDLGLRSWGFILLLLILMLELRDKLLARDELKTGRAVQLSLLPESHPTLPGWEIRFFTRPANDVGGDLVDYLPLDESRVGISLGDVSGKGLGAALLMAKLQATLRALANEFQDLAALGTRMNEIFVRDQVADKYATLIYLEVAPNSGAVRLMNAGHLPPVIVRSRSLEELPPVAPPVGMLADSAYLEQTLELAPGDTLLVYSDGITEAMNAQEEFFGDERLMELLPQIRDLTVEDGVQLLVGQVERFVGEERPSDDISLILMRRVP